jgi:hypothetical protein
MTETADNKLLASVFETLGRAVSEDLTGASAEETARGYQARLRTLSRLLNSSTPYITAAHADGDINKAVGLVSDALDAIARVCDAGFWLAIEGATDEEVIRIAFALDQRPRYDSTSTPNSLEIAHRVLANPRLHETAPGSVPA